MLSIISTHPLKDEYMLYCPVTAIPPYFGTLKECKKAQITFEKKLKEEFEKLPDDEKKDILERLEYYQKRNGIS